MYGNAQGSARATHCEPHYNVGWTKLACGLVSATFAAVLRVFLANQNASPIERQEQSPTLWAKLWPTWPKWLKNGHTKAQLLCQGMWIKLALVAR